MEALRTLLAIAKEQGPTAAGYALLLGFVAWIAGKGAKAAIANVQSLLTMNEQLRLQLVEQLDKANAGRDEAHRASAQLRYDLTSANRRMSELEGRLAFAERRAATLDAELTSTIEDNNRLRDMLLHQPPQAPTGDQAA